MLASARCNSGEVLGFPPVNDFVPNTTPVEKKADSATNNLKPVLIRGDKNS